LREAVSLVSVAGLEPVVFGGWAEELHGLRAPGPHHDIDLLVLGPDRQRLDGLLRRTGEIREKRLSHKRAFLLEGVLVELFLAEESDGGHVSHFWNAVRWEWPPLEPVDVRGLAVAPREAITAYRSRYAEIQAHRPPS
jgi:hypothetical protein